MKNENSGARLTFIPRKKSLRTVDGEKEDAFSGGVGFYERLSLQEVVAVCQGIFVTCFAIY